MEKSKFSFVFPKLGTEKTALANPYHVTQVTAIIMDENNADMCMVYFTGTLQFICTYDEKKGFQYWYEDKHNGGSIQFIFGEDLVSCYNEDGAEEAARNVDYGRYMMEKRHFHSREEIDAYVTGVDDAMRVSGHGEEYEFVSEEDYSVLYNNPLLK